MGHFGANGGHFVQVRNFWHFAKAGGGDGPSVPTLDQPLQKRSEIQIK